MSGQLYAPTALPQEINPVPIESLFPAEIWTPDRPTYTHSLYRLFYLVSCNLWYYIIIIIVIFIRYELGLDRPISASFNSLRVT